MSGWAVFLSNRWVAAPSVLAVAIHRPHLRAARAAEDGSSSPAPLEDTSPVLPRGAKR